MFNQYPYLNLNDLNLDYILKAIKEMRYEVTNFVSINAIKYANPIQWNITSQYEKNTIVIDPVTGTAYISVAAVPAGVALTRPEYWTVVFDLGSFVTRAAQNFTSHWESETTTTATFSTPAGGWLVWGDVLYKALVNITAGDAYVVNSNIEHFTIEDLYNAYLNTIAQILAMIGDLANLTTSDTSDIVHAINSVLSDINITIGDLTNLTTTDRDSIVNAINSIITERGALANLTTADKTSIVNAINDEVQARQNADNALQTATKEKPFINVKDYGAVGDGVTDDYQAFVDAIAAGSDTGATVIVPDGNYYLSAEPAVTNLNSGDNLNLLLGYNVEFSGAGAGNPNNPVFNGKLLSPVCNKGNRLRGFSFKSYDKHPSPAGNGSVFHSIEWLADTTDDYINVTGSIANGSYIMTLSSVDGVSLGAGVVPVNPITGFPDGSTKQNTARVTAIDFANNTIEIGFPSANPSAWAGIATSSPWTGASISNQPFKIRKRAWNVTQFIGALAGSGNVDRIAYGQNIVTSSEGNLTYGIELDMDFGSTQSANADVIHKGLYILGFGAAQPLSRAISIEHSASNWTAGVVIENALHGIDIDNVGGGVRIHPEFFNRVTNTTGPIEFGITTDDISDAELVTKLPIYAGTQITNGSCAIYIKRNTDTSPSGLFIQFVDAAGNQIFGVDVAGNMGVPNVIAGAVSTGALTVDANMVTSGAVTPAHYITIASSDGHTYAIPAQQLS